MVTGYTAYYTLVTYIVYYYEDSQLFLCCRLVMQNCRRLPTLITMIIIYDCAVSVDSILVLIIHK